jgi:cation:H+ antiporter
VGSNVFNLGFVLGGLAMVRGLPTSRNLVRRDGPVLIAAAVLVAWFLLDGQLVSWEGGALVALWLGYVLTLLVRRSAAERGLDRTVEETVVEPEIDTTIESVVPDLPGEMDEWEAVEAWPRWRLIGGLLLGLVLLLGGARVLILSASGLARTAGIADWVIGLTVVAAGTSLPEFATAAAAVRRGSHGVSVGTLIGSDLSNLLLALGVAAVLDPLVIGVPVLPNFGPLVLTVVLVVALALTEERVSRLEGALLVAVAAARWLLPLL